MPSKCPAMARPIPLLLPVTTAQGVAGWTGKPASLNTYIAFVDELLRAGHVIALELDEVVHAARMHEGGWENIEEVCTQMTSTHCAHHMLAQQHTVQVC
jgi:hypothetical protein